MPKSERKGNGAKKVKTKSWFESLMGLRGRPLLPPPPPPPPSSLPLGVPGFVQCTHCSFISRVGIKNRPASFPGSALKIGELPACVIRVFSRNVVWGGGGGGGIAFVGRENVKNIQKQTNFVIVLWEILKLRGEFPPQRP